jgi:superfamily II DNA or RNA helicase
MSKTFKDIEYPETLRYRSDSSEIPLKFFEDTFPVAKKIDLLLGYFSSNAFKVLSESFAEFIFNGGEMRLITNHFLSFNDKENLFNNTFLENESQISLVFKDIATLEFELSDKGQHFFDCLKYLLKQNRIQIVPIKFNKEELAHSKIMILFDGDNYISTDGSINFTKAALTKNSESFELNLPWKGEVFEKRVKDDVDNFNLIFSKKHKEYNYIDSSQIEAVIYSKGRDKDIQDLLDDSILLDANPFSEKVKRIKKLKKVNFEETIKTNKISPKFPEEEPYEYQKRAYNAWKENEYKGLFAMATGTGKTLTAIYCLVEEFKINKTQKNIIIVPGEELVNQWSIDFHKANFSNIFLWYSKNKKLNKEIEDIKILKDGSSLNIIITYDSFQMSKFQSIFKQILKNYTIIFDEAHNIGAQKFKSIIKTIEFNRLIGLSATPLRQWDEGNTNQFIEDLFNSPPPYTFSFSMEEAIEKKFLCPYKYYPEFTELTEKEFESYLYWTKKILILKDGSINGNAATQRQLVLDTAEYKEKSLLHIIQNLIDSNQYKYTLVYCPKGKNEEEERIIKDYAENAAKKFKSNHLNIQFFLGETDDRHNLLKDFESGNVDMLFAIKCLDEGVNIPITQNAIFIASGKNYREFIQRRGRVLRKYNKLGHKKEFANIFDIVVLPTKEQYNNNKVICTKLIVAEFRRLIEFYKMAIPDSKTLAYIDEKLKTFELSYYYILELISREDEQRKTT